jgi:threonine synthase
MNYVSGYQCTICQKQYPKTYNQNVCEECGDKGILDIQYDYEAIKSSITKEAFRSSSEFNIWRYLPFLPVHSKPDHCLNVGGTPLYRAKNIEKDLHINSIYIKDEGVNPTGSLKDRASIIACTKALEEKIQDIACSSTGNAATSLAGNAAKLGLKTHIFVPKRVPDGKLAQLIAYGANVIKVNGDYKSAFSVSKLAIEKFGFYNRNAAINPYLVEGKKTVVMEIIEQLDFQTPDYIIVSVGDGCTIGSIYNGLFDWKQIGWITKMPKIIGVQAKGCAPFYEAYKTHQPLQETDENTIADSIAVGIPRNPVKGMRAVSSSGGMFINVSDEEIVDAILYLGSKEGIFAEPASAASIAGLIKLVHKGMIKKSDKVVVLHTGNGLKDPKAMNEITQSITLFNEDDDLNKIKQKVAK